MVVSARTTCLFLAFVVLGGVGASVAHADERENTGARTERKALRVAVYDLEAAGVDPIVARVLTDALVEEVRKLVGIAVVSMSEIKAMLDIEAQKQLVGCSADSCLSEIAEAVGVDGLVVGSLARVGDENVLVLKRIDQLQASTAGSFQERSPANSSDTLLAAVGPAVQKLFPERALRPGFSRGVSDKIERRLHPPPLPPWALISLLSSAGASALGTSVVGVLAWTRVGDFVAYQTDPAHQSAYDLATHNRLGSEAQTWTTTAAVLGGATGALALAAAIAWPLTNFDAGNEQ